jgi:hypothetical protein
MVLLPRSTPRARTALEAVAVLALAAALLPGCGGDSEGNASPVAPVAASRAEHFPSAKGKTIRELLGGLPSGPILAPGVSTLEPGTNRFGFALFDVARKQIVGAPAAIYVASMNGDHVRGPFPARSESLAVDPRFISQTTSQDPNAAKAVYVADPRFGRRRDQAVVALARFDGRLVASSPVSVRIGAPQPPPLGVGDRAPKIHTPTVEGVGGNEASIDTRVPPAPTLHGVDFADVVGHKPVVLVFATPQLCQSRVCGPVVDIEAQLQRDYGSRVDFIHMEIYNDNQVAKGYRPQPLAFHLQSEPWTYLIGADGRVFARFEGPVSASEVQKAIERMLKGR